MTAGGAGRLLAWIAAMLLTLALSYLHALWAFPLAPPVKARAGDHYIFKHHITQNVMMSVFAVAAFAEGGSCASPRWQATLRRTNARFWFWIAVAVAAAINILFSFSGRAGYLTLLVNLVMVALVAFIAAGPSSDAGGCVLSPWPCSPRPRHSVQRRRGGDQRGGVVTGAASPPRLASVLEYASKSIELIRRVPFLVGARAANAMEYCPHRQIARMVQKAGRLQPA